MEKPKNKNVEVKHLPISIKSVWAIRVLVGGLAFILLLGAGLSQWLDHQDDCDLYESPHRSIINQTIDVTPLWSLSNVGLRTSDWRDDMLLQATDDYLLVGRTFCQRIYALDWLTGEVMWISDAHPKPLNQITSIAYDSQRNRVYAVESDTTIRAHSAETGDFLWMTSSPDFARRGHQIAVFPNGTVIAYTSDQQWAVDSHTGNLTELSQPIVDHPLTDLKVRELFSGALNLRPEVIANPVMHNDFYYDFIDLYWLRVTPTTGENAGNAVGIVVFSPPDDTSYLHQGNLLAVNDTIVAIYFEDTGILSAYELSLFH